MIRSSYQQQGMGKTVAEENANRFISSLFYWGEESLVNGGYYLGASIFFLFVLSMIVLHPKERNWIIAGVILSILLALGRHLEGFNRFLFENLPIYNKFRVPSMALVLVFVLLPFSGILGLQRWLSLEKSMQKQTLLKAGIATGGFLLLMMLLGQLGDFAGMRDDQLAQQGFNMDQLLADRKALQRNSTAMSLVFAGAIWFMLWSLLGGKLKRQWLTPALALIIVADLWMFDKQHLGNDDFLSAREFDAQYAPTQADQMILQDTDPHFRVMNTLAGLTSDSYTSYYHKSIGGYHGAKLIRYQDIIENHLSRNNQQVFHMLNAKYFIVQGENGQEVARLNPNALGNAWFVNDIQLVADADSEINALGESSWNPATTAIIDQRYGSYVEGIQPPDQGSSISLVNYDPKTMTYKAMNTTGQDVLAVFSEIYYEGYDNDWKVSIDGEDAEHIRVNYLLRGLCIPPGEHEITFTFEPVTYYMGEKINLFFSLILLASLLASIGLSLRKARVARPSSE
jgi:hypothetical protein